MGHSDALDGMPSLYQLKGGVLVAYEGDSPGDIIDQGE